MVKEYSIQDKVVNCWRHFYGPMKSDLDVAKSYLEDFREKYPDAEFRLVETITRVVED